LEERLYDLILIARPATPEDEIKKVLTTSSHAVAEKGGKIEKDRALGHAASWLTRSRSTVRAFTSTSRCARITASWFTSSNGGSACWDSVIKYQNPFRLDEELSAEEALAQSASSAPPPVRAA